MTTFGYILLALLVVSLFFKFKYTLALLIVSCIFMNTTVVNAGGKIIQPYLLCSFFVVLRTVLKHPWKDNEKSKTSLKHPRKDVVKSKTVLKRPRKIAENKNFKFLFFFVAYATITTLLCPIVFDGLNVLDKGIDSSIDAGGMSLHFGMSNVTQLGYLLLNCSTLYCIYIKRGCVNIRDLQEYFIATVLIAVIFGFWEFTSKTIGIYFPSDFIFNAAEESGWLYVASVYGYMRLSSVFGESSFCGAFMASSFWGIMGIMEKCNWKFIVLLCSVIICLILGISGTGILTFAFGGLIYAVSVKKLKIKFIIVGILAVLTIFAAIIAMGYWDIISLMLTEKSESDSGTYRSIAIMHSLQVFFDTYMIGCGMGSTRSSSFLADLLASVGIVGTFCFAYFYYHFIKERYHNKFVFLYLMTMLVAQTIAIPDFSFCSFWLMMFIGAAVNTKRKKYKRI